MIASKINSIVIRKAPNEIPKKLFSYNYSRKAFFGTERWKKGVCPKKLQLLITAEQRKLYLYKNYEQLLLRKQIYTVHLSTTTPFRKIRVNAKGREHCSDVLNFYDSFLTVSVCDNGIPPFSCG